MDVTARRTPAIRNGLVWLLFTIGSTLAPGWAYAQQVPPGAEGPLTDPFFDDLFNDFERLAAVANQAVYNALLPFCGPNSTDPAVCTGLTQEVFNNTQELNDTAAEILSGAPQQFSLQLDTEDLGFALRWTAAEELLAQGSMASDFANNQQSAMGSRVAAIRMASRSSLMAAAAAEKNGTRVASHRPTGGGAAGADDAGGVSRLGIFFDAASGYGDRDDTTFAGGFEDGFDFEGYEYSLGLDYRFSNSFVAGALFGYSDQYVDFNSAQSIVDGDIASDGYSLIAFLQWDQLRYYATASVGYQPLSYDIFRKIEYPSLNPNVASVNTATRGTTDSSATLATLNFGFPWQYKAFGADLYVKGDYRRVKVDEFTERQAQVPNNSGEGFQFRVAEQTIKSFDAAAGLKLQAVLTPNFGVFVPFVRGEYHRELEDQPRRVSTIYAGLPQDVLDTVEASLVSFGLLSDAPDTDYYTVTAGMSAVLRGSQRVDESGVARGGLQGYLQYMKVFDLDHYEDSVISGGLRYEF